MAFSESDFEFKCQREHILTIAELCEAASCNMSITPSNDGLKVYTYNDAIALRLTLPNNMMGSVLTTTPATWSMVPVRVVRPLKCLPKDDQVSFTFLTSKARIVSDVNTFEIERYDFRPSKLKQYDLPLEIDIVAGRLNSFLTFVRKEKPELFTVKLENNFLTFLTKGPSAKASIRCPEDNSFERTFKSFPAITALLALISHYAKMDEKDKQPEFNLSLDPKNTKSPLRFCLETYMGPVEIFLNNNVETEA